MHGCFVSIEYHLCEERWLTSITAPLINLSEWRFLVDVIDARLSGFVLLVSTETMDLMFSANVYSCPKVHEFVDVRAVTSDRPKFLNQLWFEEWFEVVDRPREAPEGDVILRNQSRVIVKQHPHCSLEVRKNWICFLKPRLTVNLNRDCSGTPIEVAEAAEGNDGRVYRQFPVSNA